MGCGVDVHLAAFRQHLAGKRVDLGDPLHRVAKELDADDVVAGDRLEFEDIAADAEARARELRIVALVLEVHEVPQHPVAAVVAADLEVEHRGAVVDRCADPVDARYRGDDDHVAPLEERAGGVVPQPIDLVVPG